MIINDQQREENFQEYLRLREDPNYYDVSFDEKSGGVSAVHKEHYFDKNVGPFGIPKGEYEKITVNTLRKRGHLIYLESENAPDGVKTPDGVLDGQIMEIKAIEGIGKWAIKDKFLRDDSSQKYPACIKRILCVVEGKTIDYEAI